MCGRNRPKHSVIVQLILGSNDRKSAELGSKDRKPAEFGSSTLVHFEFGPKDDKSAMFGLKRV